MAVIRGCRVRDAGVGGLVQQSPATGAHRQHPAGRSRGTLLCHDGATRHGGVTQTKRPPANPGRFTSLLKDALTELGGTPKDHDVDVVSQMMAQRSLGALIDKDCFAVVNTTGSATVRETLGSTAYSGTRPRVVEACHLSSGEAGLMTVEGA